MIKERIQFFLKNEGWFVLGFLVIAWVIWINRFPNGYIIAGEDVNQIINLKEQFGNLYYANQGRASLFLFPFYLFSLLGISESTQLSFYLGLFLISSYVSFDIFSRFIFSQKDNFFRFLLSLFYALNLYTLGIFTYAWGFSFHQSLYIFIPLLTAFFMLFLKTGRLNYGLFFVCILFLSSVGFTNQAFAFSLGIFLTCLSFFLFLTGYFTFTRQLLFKSFIVIIFSFGVSAYWIFPTLLQAKAGINNIATSTRLDLPWWLAHTSNPIINTLRLLPFNESSFFPENFPYPSFKFLKPLFLFLTALPILFVGVSALFLRKNFCERRLIVAFSGMLLIFCVLVARSRFPFSQLNNFLFQLPAMNALRGYEKLAIFTPFIVTVLLLLVSNIWRTKVSRGIATILLLIIVLTPAPFYVGSLQQNMSFILAREKAKDFHVSKYSFLVEIPPEYFLMAETIQKDSLDVKIAGLPYNVVGSLGWANYPKWKLQGVDITQYIFSKKILSPNEYIFKNWLFTEEWRNSQEDPSWIIDLFGLMNTKYILYHHDVSPKFIKETEEKISYLKQKKLLTLLKKEGSLELYEIPDQYILPHIFLSINHPTLDNNMFNVRERAPLIRQDMNKAEYFQENPVRYVIKINTNSLENNFLTFNEPFDNNWEASYKKNGKKYSLPHVQALGYANGWKIDEIESETDIFITYRPMEMFLIGRWISGLSLLGVIIFIIYFYAQRRKNTVQ